MCWISCPLHLIAELFHYKLFLSKSALFEESLDNVELVGIWILHQEYLTRGTSIQIFVVDKVEVSEVEGDVGNKSVGVFYRWAWSPALLYDLVRHLAEFITAMV